MKFNLLYLTFYFQDPASWNEPMTTEQRRNVAFSTFSFKTTFKSARSVSLRTFLRKFSTSVKKNGESFKRNWIRISPKTQSVYCLPCCLFTMDSSLSRWSSHGNGAPGFNNFRRSHQAVRVHETSVSHLKCMRNWMQFIKETTTIRDQLVMRRNTDLEGLRQVLRGLLDAVMFLAQNNLAFRGASDAINDNQCGNFLNLVQLLAKYHAPLAGHLKGLAKGKCSFLSPCMQNEFISLCGNAVRQKLLEDIRTRKYFSIMFDGTPDVSRQDQMSQVIRSVECSRNGCVVHENFIEFTPSSEKTGEGIADVIIQKLEKDGLNFENCREKSYDNAANMSGKYKGVQSRLREINSLAVFIPCAAHSLNLVGSNSAEKTKPGKLLLGEIQNLYVFFAGSTSRWKILKEKSNISLKCQSSTRWSSKADAVSAVWNKYSEIVEALQDIAEGESFAAEVSSAAYARLTSIQTFRFILGLGIWKELLTQINLVNQFLQKKDLDVSSAKKKLEKLYGWLEQFKATGYETVYNASKNLADENSIELGSGFEDVRRGRGIHRKYGRGLDVVEMSNEERFKYEFFDGLCDLLLVEMAGRFEQIYSVTNRFQFLWGSALSRISEKSPAILREQRELLENLCEMYPEDLDRESFASELQVLPTAIEALTDLPLDSCGPLDVLNTLYMNELQESFVNCAIALRMFLTLPVAVASNERSFSKMKLIKTYLRSRMSQDRLSDLALLSIEKDVAKTIDMEEIIDKFANGNMRRRKLM